MDVPTMGGFNQCFNDVFNSMISSCPQPQLGFGAGFVPPQLQTEAAVSRQHPGVFVTKHLLFIHSKALCSFLWVHRHPPTRCSERPTNEFP